DAGAELLRGADRLGPLDLVGQHRRDLVGERAPDGTLDDLHREVARHLVTGTQLAQLRLLVPAALLSLPAAGVEHAAGGRVDRAGQGALEQDPRPPGTRL